MIRDGMVIAMVLVLAFGTAIYLIWSNKREERRLAEQRKALLDAQQVKNTLDQALVDGTLGAAEYAERLEGVIQRVDSQSQTQKSHK